MQSQCAVYEAIAMCCEEERRLGGEMANRVNNVKNSKAAAEQLEKFIEEAYERGVVSTAEATEILEPIREHMKAWQARLRKDHLGLMRQSIVSSAKKGVKKSVEKVASIGSNS